MNEKKPLSVEQRDETLGILKTRFEANMARHNGIEWEDINKRLTGNNEKLRALFEMEETGGEPDVIHYDKNKDAYTFFDCSAETPKGRRSLGYDREALDGRKENKPHNSAVEMALEMGVEILTEKQYRELQRFGVFDTKTSSWVHTPDTIRKLGGAIFCDRRYDTVFTYHNGAESYYSARGFRSFLDV